MNTDDISELFDSVDQINRFINALPVSPTGTYLLAANNLSDVANTNTSLNNLLPSQATHAGEFLTTDGTNASWSPIAADGITSLNGLGAAVQTFSKVDDTNMTLTITSVVANHQFALAWAGTLADGRIASAATWNAKQDAISLTTVGTSGAATFIANVLNIPQYQAAGTYVTSLTVTSANGFAGSFTAGATPALTISTSITGILIGNGTAVSAATNTDITGKLLTGYVSGAGVISAADSILGAIQKLNGNIGALTTGVSSVNSLTGAVPLTGTANRITISAANVFDISAAYDALWQPIDASLTTIAGLTESRGAIMVCNSTPAWSILSLGNAGKILRSDGSDLKYSSSTFADTFAANNLLYASAANTVTGLATANSGLLVTDGSGVPSIATAIPNGVTSTTQSAGDNSTKVATTAYADRAAYYEQVLVITGGSDVTTTSNVASNITGLAATVATSSKYFFTGTIHVGCNNTGGVKIAITLPASATMYIWTTGKTSGSTGYTSEPLTTSGSLNTVAYIVANSSAGYIDVRGTVTTAGTAGTVQFQFASGTNTQTSTAYLEGTGIICKKVS